MSQNSADSSGQGENRLLVGISAMLTGMACLTVMDATAKWLGEGYAISQIVFFRNFFSLIPVAFIVWFGGGLPALRTRRLKLHLLRGVFILVAIYSFFYGLRFMQLAEAVSIAFLAPLFVAALSVPILGEKVGPRRWTAVLIGLLGALIIIRPGTEVFKWASLLPATAALSYAFIMVIGRKLSRTDSNAAIMVYGTFVAVAVSGIFLPFDWRMPSLIDWLLLLEMGVLGGSAIYFITVAYRNAQASLVAPFEYSALLWGLILGWLLWREFPGAHVWLGAGIVIASGIYLLYRENQVARQKVRAVPETPVVRPRSFR